MIEQSAANFATTSKKTNSPKERSSTLPIVETFHSIQGEGFWAGTNAFFIRLAGCDVGCPWCDTKHSWSIRRHPQRKISDLTTEVQTVAPQIVVITGGEPLMHDLSSLTWHLKKTGLRVHLETSGTHPFSGTFDWVTFSPKRFKQPHPSIYPMASELKVVITDDTDLEWAEEQANKVNRSTAKLLQPEWTTPSSKEKVFNYVLKHPEWRVSFQTHKFLGVQ